jgi:putative cardiolipin synthase
VAKAIEGVQSELLMITPYLIPGQEGMQMFRSLRERNVRVRVLTNSLESSTVLVAQAGYMHYRAPLLQSGVELYEIRSLLGDSRGSGQSDVISRYGNYSLHAKMFVLDRKRLFIGSNAYRLAFQPAAPGATHGALVWRTQEDGTVVDYLSEPARSVAQRSQVNVLSLLPLDQEL